MFCTAECGFIMPQKLNILLMSWYLFKESPAVQLRGKKIIGFQDMHRPKVNISWGLNDKSNTKPQPDVFPSTIVPRSQSHHHEHNNMRVLTESSDNQEELMTLIKNQMAKNNEKQILDLYKKSKNQSISVHQHETKASHQNNRKNNRQNNYELNQRIKYLQQNLLPSNKRDSINAVLNHDLNKIIPLSESQVSYRSSFHNKKNQSTIQLGDGFNVFIPPRDYKKQLTDELIERYDYQERCKKRMQRSNIVLG